MKKSSRFAGLDVHKEFISVAVAQDDRGGEIRYMGTIGTSTAALDKLVAWLSGDRAELRLCYEAGPWGYGSYRHLTAIGADCVFVAPSQNAEVGDLRRFESPRR